MNARFQARLSKFDAVRLSQVISCIVLATCLLAATTIPSVAPADPARYITDIRILAAPDMEGRGPGTKGIEKASKYIEHRYKSLGLRPAGTQGYLQPFTVTTGAKLRPDNDLVVTDGAQKQPLKINQDYEPISFSASGSFAGPVVFVGYGASAEEFQYDDYAGVDVKDKVVVILRYEPDTIRCQEWPSGVDAALAVGFEGHQRAQSRSEGRHPGQRQAG